MQTGTLAREQGESLCLAICRRALGQGQDSTEYASKLVTSRVAPWGSLFHNQK